MNKALSTTDILAKKFKLFDFEGAFYDAFGKPEMSGVWFVYGNSGNGKTSFLLQLAKELSRFEKVLYNSLEEGESHTMQEAWQKNNMQDAPGKVQLICEPISELEKRLEKRQSAGIIFVDSWQYTFLSFADYMKLKKKFPNKLFIFNSQCDGKNPMGKSAIRVMYDASLKIWVEGFKAFSKGRYVGPTGEYVIWDEGAERYWGSPM